MPLVPTPETNVLTVNPGPGSNANTVTVNLSANALPTPPGPTVITPTTDGLGSVALGSTATATFTVTNNGTVNSTLNSITLTGSAEFTLAGGTCTSSTTLPPAPGPNSCTIVVDFTPTVADTESATVTVGLVGQPNLTATVSGTGVGTTYTITSGPINFGNVTAGGQSPNMNVVVSDVGPAAISLWYAHHLLDPTTVSSTTMAAPVPAS